MKLCNDDMMYGSRSAIQKAVRRGDLDLARSALDLLFSDYKQKSWLEWRLITLVVEEAWHMIGEYAEFMQTPPGMRSDDDLRRFIYKLVVATKSKDTHGLYFMMREPSSSFCNNHPELEAARHIMEQVGDGEPSSVANFVYDYALSMFDPSKYELDALDLMKERVFKGGMLGDRFICLTGMLLTAFRGIDKELVTHDIQDGIDRWIDRVGERRKPVTVDIPWYCFDMHTFAGKTAMGMFERNHLGKFRMFGNDLVTFRTTWFLLVSAYMPMNIVNYVTDEDAAGQPSCIDTLWWIPALRAKLAIGGLDPRQVKNAWDAKVGPVIQNCVEWLLTKRAEK